MVEREIWRVRERHCSPLMEHCRRWTNWSTCGYSRAEVRLGRRASEGVFGRLLLLYTYLLLRVCSPASLLVSKIWTWRVRQDSRLVCPSIWLQRSPERSSSCFTSVCLFCKSHLTPYKEKTSGNYSSSLTKTTVWTKFYQINETIDHLNDVTKKWSQFAFIKCRVQ